MEEKEKIKVFILFKDGKTKCICKRSHRRCGNKECQADVVERDRYYGWQEAFRQNRYGK